MAFHALFVSALASSSGAEDVLAFCVHRFLPYGYVYGEILNIIVVFPDFSSLIMIEQEKRDNLAEYTVMNTRLVVTYGMEREKMNYANAAFPQSRPQRCPKHCLFFFRIRK